MVDEHEVIDAEDVVIDDVDDADGLDAAQAEVDKAAATVDVSKVKEMTTSVRNELEAINEEMAVGKMENCINGVPLPTFIFQRFVNRLDPIEYCQNVLRDHYPEEKRYLHSNQIEFIRAACNPKVRRTAALMARQCLVKGTVIHTRDGGLLRIEDHPAAWHTQKDAPVLEIHAHGGHVVTCTKNHPIFTPDGWKQAADLHVGDKVVCMYAWSKWSDRYAVISMDACELMGMFSAVTHVSIVEDNTLRVVCNSKAVMNRLKHLVRAVCTDVVMHHPARSQGVLHVPMDNTLATLVKMFGKPGQINVNVVCELSKAQTCAYLHGVYNMTATVATLRRKYITYNADANMGANKLQADVVRELLLKLGVRARVKPACGKWYIVRFKGERNRRAFIDNIGVPLGRKFPKCDEVKKMKFITGEDGEQLYVSRVTSIKPAGTADVYDVEYPGKGWFIAGGIKVHNSGKCLAPGTEVRMADGSLKKVEDIVVGDQLYPVDRGYAVVKKVNCDSVNWKFDETNTKCKLAVYVDIDENATVVLDNVCCTAIDGKMVLPVDSKLTLVSGETRMASELCVGDKLLTVPRKPSIVTSLAHGMDEMYKVVPDDSGITYVVNSEHLLSLLDERNCLSTLQASNAKLSTHCAKVVSVEMTDIHDAVRLIAHVKHGGQVVVASDVYVPVVKWMTNRGACSYTMQAKDLLTVKLEHTRMLRVNGIEYPLGGHNELPVDPYYLGLWVGDGHYVSTKITNIDEKIVQYLHEYAERLGLVCVDSKVVNGHVVDHKIRQRHISSVNPLLDKLKQLGVIGVAKHIPKCVMSNTLAVRRAFAAGLIDSDGCGKKSGISIVMKRAVLAEQCAQLMRSLGFRVSVYNHGISYEVMAYGDTALLPILLERKNFTPTGTRKFDPTYFGFIAEVVDEPVKCVTIRVNSLPGDELLLGNFTRLCMHDAKITLAVGTELMLANGEIKHVEDVTANDQLLIVRDNKLRINGWRLIDKNVTRVNAQVQPCGHGEYYGFTLDDQSNKLFLLADGTVTHNTESVASICGYLCDNYPQMRVGVFTPRLQQAETDIGRMSMFYQMNENLLNNQIVSLNKDKVELSNKSYAMAVSASDQSNIEGYTFDVIILDEAQKVSNYTWSERVVPMGGATNAKLIKVGTPKTRNHFYDCVEGKAAADWMVFRRDWTQCPQLWALDSTMLPDKDTGELRPYSTFVMAQMPKALKQWYFPNNPETWTEGTMDIIDFRTQYMLEFVDGAGTYLSKDQVDALGKGEFDWLEKGVIGEKYVAGIDFAGSNPDGDATHITVLRVNPDGSKHKVFAKEFNETPYPQQMYEIARLFGGYTPVFQVSKIFADYTGCGAAVVQTLRDEYGLSMMEGIIFNQTDRFTHSGMNMKNIMYAKFLQALDGGKFVYPSLERFTASELPSAGKMNTGFYHKMIGEWADLEVITGYTVNKKIQAPKGYHDDVCDADVLANFTTVAASQSRMPRPAFARVRW